MADAHVLVVLKGLEEYTWLGRRSGRGIGKGRRGGRFDQMTLWICMMKF